jgi:hypothetical protein
MTTGGLIFLACAGRRSTHSSEQALSKRGYRDRTRDPHKCIGSPPLAGLTSHPVERTIEMGEVVKLKRRPRPLRKTYQPSAPYEVEREDNDDGSITFWVADMRPETYRTLCHTNDDMGRNGYAKHDAEQIARGLNLLVQYGKEKLPTVKDRELSDDLADLNAEDSDD